MAAQIKVKSGKKMTAIHCHSLVSMTGNISSNGVVGFAIVSPFKGTSQGSAN